MAATATLCDSCKVSSARLFCRADSAFLCLPCDGMVHAGNKHPRVWMCDVCEQAPASITCKADAATLCVTCDRDIHSANPLASRHERFPVVPFYDSAAEATKIGGGGGGENDEHHYLLDFDVNVAGSEDLEAEAASWLLQNPNLNRNGDGSGDDQKVDESETEYLFNEIDPYLSIDLKAPDQKLKPRQILRGYNSPTDGVVPVQTENDNHDYQIPQAQVSEYVVEGLPAFDSDYAGSKPFLYNFTSQSISQSVSSSSLEIDVGVVPGHTVAMADVSNHHQLQESSAEVYPTPAIGFDREARVLRYREKRKNRKFEKTIRYASRKAYAETRPRIKGRFAKRTEIYVDSIISPESSYGVVPSY